MMRHAGFQREGAARSAIHAFNVMHGFTKPSAVEMLVVRLP